MLTDIQRVLLDEALEHLDVQLVAEWTNEPWGTPFIPFMASERVVLGTLYSTPIKTITIILANGRFSSMLEWRGWCWMFIDSQDDSRGDSPWRCTWAGRHVGPNKINHRGLR